MRMRMRMKKGKREGGEKAATGSKMD